MIPFREAKKLKEGDVVFVGTYECQVVNTKVNSKTQTVAITYTDGTADTFEGSSEELSLTRDGQPDVVPDKTDAPTAVASVKKRRLKSTPLPQATYDIMVRLKAGMSRDLQWRSLDWFEQDRVKVAGALSEKLGIPFEEFADTDETAYFHFMTLALAIGKWLGKSGWQELDLRDTTDMNQLEQLARSKVMSGILVRLFTHRYVQNIGEMEDLGSLIKAFTQASGVSEAMFGHVLTAHGYVRQSALLMAQHLADGSNGDCPVTVDFFEAYSEFLRNDESEFMPSDAVVDASMQLQCTMQFLSEQADLPASLDGLPEDEASSHNYLRQYLKFAGLYRTPARFRLKKLSLNGATLGDALDSLADDKPLVLLDTIFQNGDGSVQIAVPINPLSRHEDSKSLPALIAAVCKKLPVPPTIAVAMYPMV